MANKAIHPIYFMDRPNVPLILFKECCLELRVPSLIFGRGSVEFRWQPSTSLHFKMDPLDAAAFGMTKVGMKAILNISTNSPVGLDVIIDNSNLEFKAGKLPTCRLEGKANSNRWNDVLCDEVRFHIANMHQYIGSLVIYSSKRSSSRISLSYDNWEITIDGVENLKELIDALDIEGGFAITHVGTLKHKDRVLFKVTDAVEQMRTLGFFLSFVEGRWCCPFLLVGMLNSEIVFRDLSGCVRIDRWMGNWRWSVKNDAKYLDDAYKGFMSKWKDPKWVGAIALIIEFYVRANTYSTVELSVLDSFMALDRLASAYDPEIDNKNGSVRIYRVISEGGLIKKSLPTALCAFFDAFYKKNCLPGKNADGATVLTDFRNGVVHGNRAIRSISNKNRPKLDDDGDVSSPPVPFEARIEAEELGLWYVEMSLLYLFGYEGEYNDRLSRAQDVKMPWAK